MRESIFKGTNVTWDAAESSLPFVSRQVRASTGQPEVERHVETVSTPDISTVGETGRLALGPIRNEGGGVDVPETPRPTSEFWEDMPA